MQPGLVDKAASVTNPAIVSTPVQRLLSLDVVRGITIAFMIMVNNNGGPGSWHFMNHAEWNGLTPTDLVFPTFVFVVGVSIVFAFDARLARGTSRAQLARHTVQRAAVLVVFGIIVNSFPFFALPHMRFYGVLQRIAVCYLVVGLFYLWDQRASTKVIALVASLVGYWILVRWTPIPGVGLPGRDIPFMDMTQNLVSWIDRHLFPYHLYLYSPDHNVRDPEGLLSDLPAYRHRAHGSSRRPLAAFQQSRSGQDRGAGRCFARQSRPRLSLVSRISAEQKHVDELVCSRCSRILSRVARLCLLGR